MRSFRGTSYHSVERQLHISGGFTQADCLLSYTVSFPRGHYPVFLPISSVPLQYRDGRWRSNEEFPATSYVAIKDLSKGTTHSLWSLANTFHICSCRLGKIWSILTAKKTTISSSCQRSSRRLPLLQISWRHDNRHQKYCQRWLQTSLMCNSPIYSHETRPALPKSRLTQRYAQHSVLFTTRIRYACSIQVNWTSWTRQLRSWLTVTEAVTSAPTLKKQSPQRPPSATLEAQQRVLAVWICLASGATIMQS